MADPHREWIGFEDDFAVIYGEDSLWFRIRVVKHYNRVRHLINYLKIHKTPFVAAENVIRGHMMTAGQGSQTNALNRKVRTIQTDVHQAYVPSLRLCTLYVLHVKLSGKSSLRQNSAVASTTR